MTEIALHSAQLNAESARVDSYDGRVHVVAPVVAVRESVLKGNYLPNEELQGSAPAWNGVPLPVGHPQEDGEFVSANTPERLEAQSVGRFFNVNAAEDGDGAFITGEVWVDAAKSARLSAHSAVLGAPLARLSQHLDDPGSAGEYIDALPEESHDITPHGNDTDDDSGTGMLEVSTAYWFDPEETPGTYSGDSYAQVQRNIRPDHLALLPHTEGECSVADGCGAPRTNQNQQSREDPQDGSVATPSDNGSGMDSAIGTGGSNPIRLAANAIGRFAHNCVCGCGGSCHETMEPEELSSLTGISQGVLEQMSAEDRKALQTLANGTPDDDPDGDGNGNGGGSDEEPSDGDGTEPEGGNLEEMPDDAQNALAELRSELQETREELAEVREVATAQQQAEKNDLVNDLTGQSSMSEDQLRDLDIEALQALHDDLTPSAADYSGRVRGVPSANAGVDDEKRQEATDLAAQLKGNPATDGGTTGGDDE